MKNSNEIANELTKPAPTLASLEKVNAYEVPENYFVNFSAEILKKVRAREAAAELKQIAPAISHLKKEIAFDVPANYFVRFPQQMMKKIFAEETVVAKTKERGWLADLNTSLEGLVQIIFKPKYSLALAGVASTVIVAFLLFNKIEQCSDLDCKMASLTDTELNSYLDSNTDNYTDAIFEAGTDDVTVSKVSGIQFENEMLHDVSDADLNNAILD